MATQAIAVRHHSLPDRNTWQTTMEMAEAFVQSGLLPSAIKTPQAAALIIQKASELGLPPTYGLSNIAVINGKPVAGAELMLAVIYRDHGDNAIQFVETTSERCVTDYKRRGWSAARRYEWSMEDAKRAGLTSKGQTWNQYPAAMLRARCISAVARLAFPDSIGGLYLPEELGADVEVTDEGEVVIVQPSKPVVSIVSKPASEPVWPSDDDFTKWMLACEKATEYQVAVPNFENKPTRDELRVAYRSLVAEIKKVKEHQEAAPVVIVDAESQADGDEPF